MATAFTSLLGLALPVTGELAGTWGTTINDSITSLLDSAVSGTTTLSTDADVTLTTTTGAANQARQAILLCSGARTALRTITAPAQSKLYVVINSTTGGFGVKIVGVGPTTGVTVAAGKTAVVVWNGSDFVEISNAPILIGGTGTTSTLTLRSTSGVGTTGADIIFQTGNNGALEAMRVLNSGRVGVATTIPLGRLDVSASGGSTANATLTAVFGADEGDLTTRTNATNKVARIGYAHYTTAQSPAAILTATSNSTDNLLGIGGGTGSLSAATGILFYTGTTNTTLSGTERMRIGSDGRVGINTTSPQALLHVSVDGNGALFSRDGAAAVIARSGFDVNSDGSFFIGQRARTSIAAPSIVSSGDRTIEVWGRGYDGAAYQSAGRITIDVDGTPAAGSMPGRMVFFTTPTGTVTPVERMRIDSAGKVGIGTSAPAQLLHIASGDATALIENTAAASNATLQLKYPSRTWALANRGSDLSGAFAVRDVTAGADRLIITSAGNVGIGSLLSDSILTVASSTPIVKIRDLATAAINVGGTFYFQGYTNGVTGLNNFAIITGAKENATAADGSGYFSVQTSNSVGSSAERMRITSAGNVGIGTTTPGSPLTIGTATSVPLLINGQTTGASYISITNTSGIYVAGLNNSAGTAIGSGLAYSALVGSNSATALQLTTNGNARLTVDSAGSVGIGTNAPTSKLHVYGAGNYTLYRQETTGTATTEASWVNPSGNTLIGTDGAAGYGYVGTFVAKEFRLYTNSLERMRIDSAGNVGIGVTPVAYGANARVLHIDGGANASEIRLTNNTTGTSASNGGLIQQAGNDLYIWNVESSFVSFGTDNSEKMRITSAGNVGIGTTTPSGGLVVARANNNGTPIFGVTDTGGANNSYLNLYSRADALLFATSKNGTGTIRPIRFAINDFGDATTGVSLALETNGNVGIGITTPVNKLDINGSLGRNAPVTKTASFTLAATENWLICNGTATITVTFPAASSWTGREVMIKNIAAFTVVSASSNVVPLAGGAAGTAILPATAGAWATLVSDGTNWIIMQS